MPTNEEKLSDTNEKILMKDHDILIALHTQNSELIRRVDVLSSQLSENQKNNYSQFMGFAVVQTEQKGSIGNLKDDIEKANKRMDTMDTRWKVGDIIIALGAIAGILIGLFK